MNEGQTDARRNRQLGLPDELASPVRPRVLLVLIAGTLALVLSANLLAGWYLDRYSTNRSYRIVSAKWELLGQRTRPVDWLIVGDSSCNQGVVPEVLTAELGGTALNLCTVAGLLVASDAWMVEQFSQQAGPPRNVLVVHAPVVWTTPKTPMPLLAQVPRQRGWWNDVVPSPRLDRMEALRLEVSQFFPLYSESTTLATAIRTPWQVHAFNRRFILQDDGFMPWPVAAPAGVALHAEAELLRVREQPGRVSPINREALGRLRELAERYDFTLYLITSPLYEGLYRDATFAQHLDDLSGEIEGLLEPSPRVHVLLRQPVTFPATRMENSNHLTTEAAREYTRILAATLRSLQP